MFNPIWAILPIQDRRVPIALHVGLYMEGLLLDIVVSASAVPKVVRRTCRAQVFIFWSHEVGLGLGSGFALCLGLDYGLVCLQKTVVVNTLCSLCLAWANGQPQHHLQLHYVTIYVYVLILWTPLLHTPLIQHLLPAQSNWPNRLSTTQPQGIS